MPENVELKFEKGLSAGDQIGLFFDIGPVEHPTYGSASKLCGTIPLLLPYGVYIQPPILDDKPRYEKFIREKAVEFSDLFPNDLEADIIEKVRTAMTLGIQLYPSEDISDPKMEAYASLSIDSLAMDDVVDNLGEDERLSYTDVTKLKDFIYDLFKGVYKSPTEMPNPIPALVPFNSFMWKFSEESQKRIPGFTSVNQEFIYEFQSAMTAYILIMNPESEVGRKGYFSPKTREVFIGHNNGVISAAEYIAVAQNIHLSEKIRRDVLFQRMKVVAGIAGSAMNDMYGLGRDIKYDQVKDSNILSNVVYKNIPLQEAFDIGFTALKEAMSDVKIAANILREAYHGDEQLMKYIRVLETAVDGQTYYYARVPRYGNVDRKVVSVL